MLRGQISNIIDLRRTKAHWVIPWKSFIHPSLLKSIPLLLGQFLCYWFVYGNIDYRTMYWYIWKYLIHGISCWTFEDSTSLGLFPFRNYVSLRPFEIFLDRFEAGAYEFISTLSDILPHTNHKFFRNWFYNKRYLPVFSSNLS